MRNTVSILVLVIVALGAATFRTSAQSAPGQTRPVVVRNTSDNPVPVTGSVQVSGGVQVTNTPTVDARQSGTWGVTLNGTPTVVIDPNSAVRITRQGTRLVSNEDVGYTANASTFNIVDISEYSKVRIQFQNYGNSDVEITIASQDLSALPQVYLFEYETFTIPAHGRVNRLYDTLGSMVNMRLTSTGTGSVRIGVFGN